MCSFRRGRRYGRPKSRSVFVDLIHLTSCALRRNLRTSLDGCILFSSTRFLVREALWLRSLFSPTPVVSARRMRPLPRPQNADFTSRHSWQIGAALPACTRDESQEMCVQTSVKGLESGSRAANLLFQLRTHVCGLGVGRKGGIGVGDDPSARRVRRDAEVLPMERSFVEESFRPAS